MTGSDPLDLVTRVEDLEIAVGLTLFGVRMVPVDSDTLPLFQRVLYLEGAINDTRSIVVAIDKVDETTSTLLDLLHLVNRNTKMLSEMHERVGDVDTKVTLTSKLMLPKHVIESHWKRDRRIYIAFAFVVALIAAVASVGGIVLHRQQTSQLNSRKLTLKAGYLNCLQLNKSIASFEHSLQVDPTAPTPPLPQAQDCTVAYKALLKIGVKDIPTPMPAP